MPVYSSGIWTWGHVIYDYSSFFRNMKKLGFDRITVWNDYAPVNAVDVVNEAHKNGIKVIWGFSWGWDTSRVEHIGNEINENIRRLVLETYDSQYAGLPGDGIYFQSFTEHDNAYIDGVSVAESVVNLVNSTAEELYSRFPSLEIEFGLHANSIKNDLNIIAKTDKRIRIMWEDLGAFPFTYSAFDADGYHETSELLRKVINLRGTDEKCGFIVKSMTQLDWTEFRHAPGPLVIGCSSSEFIKARQDEKNAYWEQQTLGWMENLHLACQTFDFLSRTKNNICVQALIEDGIFENEIKLPPVIFAELIHNSSRKPNDILKAAYSRL